VEYELLYWPAADDALTELENDSARAPILRAVERALARLTADPFSPRLGTTAFVTEAFGGVSATPVGLDDWYVFWQRGAEPQTIEIIQVHKLRL
jgi:hypothetical protein